MDVSNKYFFDRILRAAAVPLNFDMLMWEPEGTNKPRDTAHLCKNTEGVRSQGQYTSPEDFQAKSRLNREPRQMIGLLGDSTVGRTFADVPDQTITSVDAILAQLEEAQRKVRSALEIKLSEHLGSLYESHFEKVSGGYTLHPKIQVSPSGVLDFSYGFNYDALVLARKDAPAIKQAPQLRVGDEVTWEFCVEGIRERTASVAIKSLGENSFMLRDSFVVDSLDIRPQAPYTKVGKVVMVRRADVVNGGHKIVYSND